MGCTAVVVVAAGMGVAADMEVGAVVADMGAVVVACCIPWAAWALAADKAVVLVAAVSAVYQVAAYRAAYCIRTVVGKDMRAESVAD